MNAKELTARIITKYGSLDDARLDDEICIDCGRIRQAGGTESNNCRRCKSSEIYTIEYVLFALPLEEKRH